MTTQATDPAVSTLLPAGTWDVDRDHSNVDVVIRHLLSRVRGHFTDYSGVITVDPDPTRSSVEVTVQAASIDTDHAERDDHLRAPDFLDVEQFPVLTFRSTSVARPDLDGRFRVDGELTVRGVTRPISLDTEYLGWSEDPWGGKRAGFTARAAIDREDFGAGWNVPLDAGGLLLSRKVDLELAIEAVLRQ